MYADDTHLIFASYNIDTFNDELNYDLTKINEWPIASKLMLNNSKTNLC